MASEVDSSSASGIDNWRGGNCHPSGPDATIESGGPTGSFLQIGADATKDDMTPHLSTSNSVQWAGDYSGVQSVTFQMKTLSKTTTTPNMFLLLTSGSSSDKCGDQKGAGTFFASKHGFPVASDGWNSYTFVISEASFNRIHGTADWATVVKDVTTLLIRHQAGSESLSARSTRESGTGGGAITATLGIASVTSKGAVAPL